MTVNDQAGPHEILLLHLRCVYYAACIDGTAAHVCDAAVDGLSTQACIAQTSVAYSSIVSLCQVTLLGKHGLVVELERREVLTL